MYATSLPAFIAVYFEAGLHALASGQVSRGVALSYITPEGSTQEVEV